MCFFYLFHELMCVCVYSFFFFKQKTAYEMRISDWSSDVCSSDLQSSAGTWRLEICDQYPSADNGNFVRTDLYLTSVPSNYADLSLTKSVSNAAPAFGASIDYVLSVTNAGRSGQTARPAEGREGKAWGSTGRSWRSQ